MDCDDEYGHIHRRRRRRHHDDDCHRHPRIGRVNTHKYGVIKSSLLPTDEYVINDTLYPQLQSRQSIDNPLYNFRDIFSAYNILSIYDYFEPKINPGPFYTYLKEIFLYLNYFTRKESLSSLNIALQKVVNFLETDETKEDISNILKNTRLLHDYAGAESDVFKIAIQLQQLRALYRGLMISDETTSNQYKDGILGHSFPDVSLQSQTSLDRLQQISRMIDEKILTIDNVNQLTADKLLAGIEVNMPDMAPLSNNIKHEIRHLEKQGVSIDKLIEMVNYIATHNVKKAKAKI